MFIGHVKCHPRIRLIFITAILKPVNLKKSLRFFFGLQCLLSSGYELYRNFICCLICCGFICVRYGTKHNAVKTVIQNCQEITGFYLHLH